MAQQNYQTFTIADALAPRPPVIQLVQGIVQAGSLNIWYGYPGSLKSMLVMDLCMAVATGQAWLQAMPNSGKQAGIKTQQTAVLWIDLDNGNEITGNRIAALARSYKASTLTPFYWMSYPTPTIQAIKMSSIASLYSHITSKIPVQPGLIVIDTLLRAAHVKDENSSEMDTVLNNIHKLAEDLGAAINLISHSNKMNMGRAGNALRGHSSIEGGVDTVYNVKREEHCDVLEVENQKARRKPVPTFSAKWTYTQDIDGESLYEARFFHEGNAPTKQQVTQMGLMAKITDALSNGPLNKSALYACVGGNRPNFESVLDQMLKDGNVIKKPGKFNSDIYDVP